MVTDIFKENNIILPTIEEADNIDNPPIIAKFTNQKWDWYVVGGDKLENNDYLLFGLVNGDYIELGTFTLKQIENVSARLTSNFENIGLNDLFKELKNENSAD